MEAYRRWAQLDLAVTLPIEAQWRCLPLRSKVQQRGSSTSRIDLVDVQGEESHAEAAEENEQVLSRERHDNALHNFTNKYNDPSDAPESERGLGEARPSGAIALGAAAYMHQLQGCEH